MEFRGARCNFKTPHCRPWIDINNRRASGQCLGTVEQIDHPPPQCYYIVSRQSLFSSIVSLFSFHTRNLDGENEVVVAECAMLQSIFTPYIHLPRFRSVNDSSDTLRDIVICADAAPRRWVLWSSRLQARPSEVGTRQDHQYYSISHAQNLPLINSSPSRATHFSSVLLYLLKHVLPLSSYFDVRITNLICYF